MNTIRSRTGMRLITLALSATIATAGLGLSAISSFAEEGEGSDQTADEVVTDAGPVIEDEDNTPDYTEPEPEPADNGEIMTEAGPVMEDDGDVIGITAAGPAEPEEITGISVTFLSVDDPLANQLIGNTVASSYGVNIDVVIDTEAADELYDLIDAQRDGADPLIRDATLELCAYQRAAESSVLFANIRPDGAFFTSVGANGRITSEILIAVDTEVEDPGASDALTALNDDELALVNNATNIGIAEIEDAQGNIYWAILLANDNANSEVGTIQSGEARYRLYVDTDAVNIQADEQAALDIDADEEESIVIPVTISGEMRYGDTTADFTETAATFENSSLVWNSSNPAVAAVDENGVVTGIAGGTCTVSATYNGNELEFLFDVTVIGEEPDEATLIDLADCMIAGISGDYTANGEPIEPPFTVIYQDNTTIDPSEYQAVYTDNIEPGIATLTVTANDGSDVVTGSVTKTFEIVAAEPDPESTEPEPEPEGTEPEPTTEEPAATEPEPEPEGTESEPTTEEPENTEPEPAAEEPEPTTEEPAATESEPTTEEPEGTESEPTTEEPAVTEPEPEPEGTESEPAAEEPENTEPEPAAEEPETTESEPESTEPEATEPEPETTESEPTTEEPEPETTEPEATESEPVTDTTVTGDTYDPNNAVTGDGTDTTVLSNPTVVNETINIGSAGYTIAAIPTQIYTGNALQPTITLNGPYGLTLGTDYILSYSNNVKVGTASVTVEGIGSYTGTLSTTFQIVGDISQAGISGLEGQTYTGAELTPAPVVTFDQTDLTAGTDYDVTYENNINAGLATVTITGKGSYTGTLLTSFTIAPKSIADAQISPIASATYTGKAISPTFTVTDGTTVLNSGTDYTVAYEQNINAGAAHIVVTGVGNYTGTIDTTFVIAPIPMSSTTIIMPNMDYNGLSLWPTPLSVSVDDLYLVEGIDYEIIDYSNNINIGDAKITLQGIGNFTGTVTADWKIVAAGDEDPGTTQTLPKTGDSTNIVAIVAGSVVGAAIIVVAIILIVRYVRNRNRQQ